MKTPDFRNFQERRKFVLYLFVTGILVIFICQCFRKENREFFARWMEVSSRNRESGLLDDLSQKGVLPGIDEKLFDLILDNSPIFSAEVPAEAQFIQVLNDSSVQTIREHCIGRVLFAQYSKQRQTYRGKVIRLKGVLKRVNRWPMPEDKFAVDALYECWIMPSDCQSEPIIVYCLQLPEGADIAFGEDMEAAVAVDAVFYKRYNYESLQGIRCAPMFFAKVPEYVQPVVQEDADSRVKVPFSLVLLASLLFGGCCWILIERRTKIPEPKEPLPQVFEMPSFPPEEESEKETEEETERF